MGKHTNGFSFSLGKSPFGISESIFAILRASKRVLSLLSISPLCVIKVPGASGLKKMTSNSAEIFSRSFIRGANVKAPTLFKMEIFPFGGFLLKNHGTSLMEFVAKETLIEDEKHDVFFAFLH